jgi:hypothetical protein
MNTTSEIKKFKIDVDKAINFMFVKELPFSLFTRMATTPNIGVKSKDDNNIYKRKKINTSNSYKMIMYQLYFLQTPYV